LIIATVSDKIETNKYPLKTRVITGLCGEARRIMAEYEANVGKALSMVPGFMMGADPGEIRRAMYTAMKQNLSPEETMLFISLDLSSWSTGMHWDIQEWTNSVLQDAFDGADDMFNAINNCTKGSLMVRAEHDIKLPFVNAIGANYEGVDGKRNTFMHCVLWYLARMEAFEQGLEGTMKAMLFIDDGAAAMKVEKEDLARSASILRRSMVAVYVRYGFKLSMLKSVVSETYVQFLNEIYTHGVHVGYGFRALCHTGSQTFPEVATVSEELAVITSGIRGSAVSGGNPARLMLGMNFILQLYMRNIIGNKGSSIYTNHPFLNALVLNIPTNAGGFGIPNYTSLFSNLSGHNEVEKINKVKYLYRSLRRTNRKETELHSLKTYMISKLTAIGTRVKDAVPNRITVSHPSSVILGSKDRSVLIVQNALQKANHPEAKMILTEYLTDTSQTESFARVFIEGMRGVRAKMPVTLLEKALATDPGKALTGLVDKIASSIMVKEFLDSRERKMLNKSYYGAARSVVRGLGLAMGYAY